MPVHFSVADNVARVTIDRPDVLNAIDVAAERELNSIWDSIEADRTVRAVVLTGSGERAFSTGADMKGGSGASGLEYWAAARPNGFGGIALRQTLDVPVIARVNGHAAGGGFEMVLGCDIVIASDNATFSLPEARVGRLPLDGGMTLLQRQIPFRAAMGVMLTGRRVRADEALALGIVNEVVPLAELD
ncbi:MAG: enoyl-CoA hydratase-related protein, partial [Beijerinckiaceae bacterium]